MAESSGDVVKRYLEDAIAAEKSFERQLLEFAKDSDYGPAKAAFQQHALEIRHQHERLLARLEALGGSSSGGKSLLAHVFGNSPKTYADHLFTAFGVDSGAVAMYESLAMMAEAAGDTETVSLARAIQAEKKTAAAHTWALLPDAALHQSSR